MGSKERSILGSEYFSYNELEDNHQLLKNNQEYLSQIITHKYSIDEIQKAYDKTDSDLVDAYGYMGRRNLKRYLNFFTAVALKSAF